MRCLQGSVLAVGFPLPLTVRGALCRCPPETSFPPFRRVIRGNSFKIVYVRLRGQCVEPTTQARDITDQSSGPHRGESDALPPVSSPESSSECRGGRATRTWVSQATDQDFLLDVHDGPPLPTQNKHTQTNTRRVKVPSPAPQVNLFLTPSALRFRGKMLRHPDGQALPGCTRACCLAASSLRQKLP